MAQYIGNRSTNQAITTEATMVRRVDEDLVLLEPNVTPLVTLLMKTKRRKGVDTPRPEWLEDDFVARWTVAGATTIANTTTANTLVVADATLFVVGDIFVLPKVISSSVAPEQCRVTAVNTSTNVLTLIRADAGTTVSTINASDPIRLIGSAKEEGSVPGTAKYTQLATKTTYLQIFSTVVDLTKTAAASRVYGAPAGDRKRLQKKSMSEHKIKINGQMLFGQASESLTGGPTSKPIRTMQGIVNLSGINTIDAGGLLTKKGFESFSRTAFRYGNPRKLLVSSPMLISAIHDWGNSFLLVKPMEKKYGVDITEVQTGHGVFLLVKDWMLENPPSSLNLTGGQATQGFGGIGMSIDLDMATYYYLSGNGISRDTHISENVILDGRDGTVDEILTECGMEWKHPKKHTKLFNITDYSV